VWAFLALSQLLPIHTQLVTQLERPPIRHDTVVPSSTVGICRGSRLNIFGVRARVINELLNASRQVSRWLGVSIQDRLYPAKPVLHLSAVARYSVIALGRAGNPKVHKGFARLNTLSQERSHCLT
jgi:hypothetical protein